MDISDTPVNADDQAHPLDNTLASQATLWVVRLTSGEATAEERQAFRRWRDESPAHAVALAEARRLWLALGPASEPARPRRSSVWLRIGRPTRISALAASIAACAVVAGYYVDVWRHDYVTGAGETRAVALSDGTHVLMSGRSALDVSFKHGVRRVTLVRGEAYFEVVHDAAQPFAVVAGDGEVRDIGTAFSVRRQGAGAAVVVARGSVEVDRDSPGSAPAMLTHDQAVAYAGVGPAVVHPANAAQELSWVRGRLILENRSLSDSVGEINRYYGGHLVLLNGDVGARRINAVIDLNRIDDWLAALDKTHAAKVVRVGSLVVLY
jgi:transmembrane sensor